MPRINRDAKYLDALRDYYAKHGVLPSYAGISCLLGFKAKQGALKLARRLVAAGYLKQAPNGKLAPEQSFFLRSMATQSVPAGSGDPAAYAYSGSDFLLDLLLVSEPSKTVLVGVRGDSMQEAGVLDGDVAVIEKAETATGGDFIAALVDGELTLKELRFEKGKPVLVPHNRHYKPIKPRETLAIIGVVKGIIRRYSAKSI